jgi:hypothetical protein
MQTVTINAMNSIPAPLVPAPAPLERQTNDMQHNFLGSVVPVDTNDDRFAQELVGRFPSPAEARAVLAEIDAIIASGEYPLVPMSTMCCRQTNDHPINFQ